MPTAYEQKSATGRTGGHVDLNVSTRLLQRIDISHSLQDKALMKHTKDVIANLHHPSSRDTYIDCLG